MASIHNSIQNEIVANLPADEFEMLIANTEMITLRAGEYLYHAGEAIRYGYFPGGAIVSLNQTMESGATAESASVGREGMVGIPLIMGSARASESAVVQVAGQIYRVPAQRLQKQFWLGGQLQRSLLRYTQALLNQTSQILACNRHHTLQQQLCRWLLNTLDRTMSNELFVTHETLANLLGVRREGVTVAAGPLQQAGYIKYCRGHVTILNRVGLEQRACECYDVVRKELNRLGTDRNSGCRMNMSQAMAKGLSRQHSLQAA